MWYLISLENPDKKYVLLTDHVYVVGRKSCDIMIAGDAAVSRKHAQIELEYPEAHIGHPQKPPKVSLTDLSKFGTSVNGDKLQTNQSKVLEDGDVVLFGNNSSFTLMYEPFIISSSCLDQPSKRKVREWLQILGGHMVNDWKKECSLLVMNNISVTIKVVCALLSLKPIVTPDYIGHYIKHLKGEGQKPNPDVFLPVITETQVDTNEVSFTVKPERRTVFQGKKFIFLNEKQFKKMHMAVELGGGLPVLLEEKYQTDKMLVEKDSIVMQCDPNNCTQMASQDSHNWILHVQAFLRKHKKHMIQDAEIGYAVLYCSTEKHCNPDIEIGSQVLNPVQSQSLYNTDVLVANTEVFPSRSPTKIKKKQCETVLDETKLENKTLPSKEVKVKQESKSSPPEQTTSSRSMRSNKRGRDVQEEEEEHHVTPFKKKIKQEALTPAENESESRAGIRTSPRSKRNTSQIASHSRSPSPASRSSARSQGASQRGKVKKEIVEDSDEEIVERRKAVVVADSDDEFSNIESKKKGKQTVASKTVISDEEFSEVQPKQESKSAKKSTHIVSDSDEDWNSSKSVQRKPLKKETSPTPRSKSKQGSDSDHKSSQRQTRKSKVLVDESDDDIEHLGTRTKKPSVENSDDEFDRLMGKAKGKKSNKEQKAKSPTKQPAIDNSDDDFDRLIGSKANHEPSKERRNGHSGDSSPKPQEEDMEAEDNDRNDRHIKTELEETGNQRGFVSTNGTEQGNKESGYTKDDDLPSRCINIQFTDLVVRRPPKQTSELSTQGVPEGFVKWKGKLVRNFKKFKKTANAGSHGLPRIIGGSDLIAHTASSRKDLDEWFKDAIQAESQQNDAERKAQELFDWEPNKKRSR